MMVHTLASSRSQEESQEAVPAVARMSKAILTGTLSDSEAYEVLVEKADYYASEDYDNPALGTSIQTVFREALAPKTLAARNGQVAKLLKQTLMKVGKLYEQDEMKKDNETGGMGASPLLRAPMSAISSTDGSLMENQRADARFYSDTITEGEVDVIDRPSEDLEEQIQWEYEQAQEAKKPTEVAEKKASRGRPKKGTREPSRGSERVKQLEERNSSLKGNTNTVEEETMIDSPSLIVKLYVPTFFDSDKSINGGFKPVKEVPKSMNGGPRPQTQGSKPPAENAAGSQAPRFNSNTDSVVRRSTNYNAIPAISRSARSSTSSISTRSSVSLPSTNLINIFAVTPVVEDPTFPSFPTTLITSSRKLTDFYAGLDIAIDNVLEDQAADATLSLLEVVNNLSDNKPIFVDGSDGRGGATYDYRAMMMHGASWVYECLKKVNRERPGLATCEVCRLLSRHAETEMVRCGDLVP